MLGRKLSHYSIQEQIGGGGMGVVYRAKDETLGRDVAIKVLRPRGQADLASYERLLKEARAASALNHPHICTVYEVGEADNESFIVMEYVAGQPLSALIPQGGLPTELVFEYGKQTADALAHAHTQGIVHRDLKGANVIVNAAGNAKLLDFGLAHRLSSKELAGATASKSLVEEPSALAGTLHYLSPEVLRGDLPDGRSDLWALGVMLFEMAAGSPPFHGRSLFELTTAILQDPPAPLPPRVPPGLRAVILRCLAKSPGQRYQQASEVRAALEALQSSTEIGPVPPTLPASRRALWILGTAAVAVLAVIATFLLRGRNGRPPGGIAPGGQLTLLVSSEGQAYDPSLSPDGKMIAYVAEDNGQFDLFVSRVSGGERVRLTNDPARESRPEFSPDGEGIVFSRVRPDTAEPEICLIPALGGEVRRLIPGGREPAWSPGGSQLVFVRKTATGSDELATAAADGSDIRTVLVGDKVYPFFTHPSWAPDSSELAVVRRIGGISRQIWLVPARGGLPRQLSKDPPGVFSDSPGFTADGLGIVHISNRGGAWNLWLLPLDGKPLVQLTSGAGPDDMPSVARNGSVAFVNSRWRYTLFLYQTETGETRPLTSHASYLWGPSFSPDGRLVAFSRMEADGAWHIWVIPATGGTPQRLTSGKVPEIYPRFTPDGTAIVYFSWGPPPHHLWRVPVNGGPATPLLPERDLSDSYADVSPDGRWIAYARTEEDQVRVYVAPLPGGQHRRLTEGPSTVPRWSPDGNWIAYSEERSEASSVWVIRADGTGARKVADPGGWPVWFPDGKHIGFRSLGPDGSQQIHIVPFEGGQSRVLSGLRFSGTNNPFDVSLDGKWIVTTNGVPVVTEIWLLQPQHRK